MENSKGKIDILSIIAVLGILVGISMFIMVALDDVRNYKEYKTFCNKRPNFCYCSFRDGGCTFRAQTIKSAQYVNGVLTKTSSSMSNDTLELCKLAKKLDDRETLFKAGCNDD